MPLSPQDSLLGRLAVNRRFVTFEQFARAATEFDRCDGRMSLSDLFVELELLSREQLAEVEREQQDVVRRREADEAVRAREQAAVGVAAPVPEQIAVPESVANVDPWAQVLTATMTVRAQSAVFTGTHRSSQPDPAPAPVERSPTASVRIPIAVFDDHAALAAALPAVPARAASSVLTRAAVHAPSPGRRSEGVVLESWALPYDDPNDPFATPTAPATLAADALAADALVDLTAEARAWLVEVLGAAVRQGASDVHVHAGESVRMRRFGRLWPISDKPLPAEVVHFGLRALLPEDERVVLDRHGQVDCSLTLPGVGRFRANVYRQHKGTDAVFRVVKLRPPTLPTLHLPPELAALTTFTQGIVLVTGPAASGKSSTLAALVHMINEERSEHVVTIEDPIEVLHSSIRCVVNQRQAGRDTRGFARALKAALREDPDVIVIGEMRDRETAQLALTAAETGHLVLATLHTQSAVSTVNRVVGEFPPNQQPQVRGMLSESLRAVVSQRLLPRKDGTGVVPAVEVLRATPAVANLIRESRTHQLRSVMQTGAALGMQTLDASLTDLVARGVVGADDARRVADDPRSFTQLPRTASHPPTPVGA